MTVVELALYAIVLVAMAVPVWRRPVAALYLFVVGLAVHNAVMAGLYDAGVRGATLTAITAWKEIVLAVALARVIRDARRARRLPFRWSVVDSLAVAFGVLVVVYAIVPQSALDGEAGKHAVALALRHDLVPVAVYFLGRSLLLSRDDLRRIAWTIAGTAAFVATLGLIDLYAVPISWWRRNGVIDYFHEHEGYDYHGTGNRLEPNGSVYGLPENFIFNVGADKPFLRRLVSTFLGPLACGYLFVVALLVGGALLRRRLAAVLGIVVVAGLLWTFSRSSLVALAAGLVVLALVRRAWPLVALAVVVLVVAFGWAHLYPKIGPTGTFTKADLTYQHEIAKGGPKTPYTATSSNEPSLHEHWASLKDGFRTMGRHPQGYGLGNVGQSADRTGTPLKAGESNYTELGVELGVLGAILWTAWGLALLLGLVRAREPFAAAFAAILVLAIQTDVIGDPWVAYVVWSLAGALLVRPRPNERLVAGATPS